MTPEQRSRAAEIRESLSDPLSPGHADAVRELEALYQAAHPQSSKDVQRPIAEAQRTRLG